MEGPAANAHHSLPRARAHVVFATQSRLLLCVLAWDALRHCRGRLTSPDRFHARPSRARGRIYARARVCSACCMFECSPFSECCSQEDFVRGLDGVASQTFCATSDHDRTPNSRLGYIHLLLDAGSPLPPRQVSVGDDWADRRYGGASGVVYGQMSSSALEGGSGSGQVTSLLADNRRRGSSSEYVWNAPFSPSATSADDRLPGLSRRTSRVVERVRIAGTAPGQHRVANPAPFAPTGLAHHAAFA